MNSLLNGAAIALYRVLYMKAGHMMRSIGQDPIMYFFIGALSMISLFGAVKFTYPIHDRMLLYHLCEGTYTFSLSPGFFKSKSLSLTQFAVLYTVPFVVEFVCSLVCFYDIMKHDNTYGKRVLAADTITKRNRRNIMTLTGNITFWSMELT